MVTYEGRLVTPTNGAPSLRDLAVQLSRIARYAGATKHFWPVSLHSMAVADLLPERLKFDGLIHDGTEAVISDIPNGFKCEGTRQMEQAIKKRLYKSFDIEPPSPTEEELIKETDIQVFEAEAVVLGPPKFLHHYPEIKAQASKTVIELVRAYQAQFSLADLLEVDGAAVQLFEQRLYNALTCKRRFS